MTWKGDKEGKKKLKKKERKKKVAELITQHTEQIFVEKHDYLCHSQRHIMVITCRSMDCKINVFKCITLHS